MQNCPVAILNSLFVLCLFAVYTFLPFCLFTFLPFFVFVFLSDIPLIKCLKCHPPPKLDVELARAGQLKSELKKNKISQYSGSTKAKVIFFQLSNFLFPLKGQNTHCTSGQFEQNRVHLGFETYFIMHCEATPCGRAWRDQLCDHTLNAHV